MTVLLGFGLLLMAGGVPSWLGGAPPKVRETLFVPFLVAWSSSELLRERRPGLARVLRGAAHVLLATHVGLYITVSAGASLRGEELGWWDAGPLGLFAVLLVVGPGSWAVRWWRRRTARGRASVA